MNFPEELIEQAENMVVPIVDDDGNDYNACLIRMSSNIQDDLRLQFPVNWFIDSHNIPNAVSVMPSDGLLVEYSCSYIPVGDLTKVYTIKDEVTKEYKGASVTLQEVLLPSSGNTSYAIVVRYGGLIKILCYEACDGLDYYLKVNIMSVRKDVSVESMIGNFVFDFKMRGDDRDSD